MEKFYLVLGNLLELIINNYADQIAMFLFAALVGILTFILAKANNAIVKTLIEKVIVAVTVVQSTVVDDLKAKKADGKLTKDEQTEVSEHAKRVFFEQIGIIGRFVYTLFVGSLDKWFETKKEFILAEIKKKLSAKS